MLLRQVEALSRLSAALCERLLHENMLAGLLWHVEL